MTLNPSYQLLQDTMIPELKTRARVFRHVKSGAELLSLENDDENKVFSINFRTPPIDSTGLPHIMEHAVLCGSQRFPVREPFVELLKGSMATFVNAMTFADKTCYPVASQNVQDFYNLIDVYMDAVLHPLITPYTLGQEGWHYELNNLDDAISYKGVVFNEMKGAYSSPDGLLSKHGPESLFPDHPYGLDSGGDPQVMPNLTYVQFKGFHDTYYHPSNARIYFYGNDDPDERLRLMDTYLQDYTAIQVESAIPLPSLFPTPKLLEFPYDPGEEETAKAMLTVNWALTESRDPLLALGTTILGHILVGTPASPLRKALIDSGLGEDLAGDGLDNQYRLQLFSTGLKGIATENAARVEALILDTLQSLATQGIDPDTVAASVNTQEFRLRENNTGQFPRGLSLMLRTLTSWLYDGDPIERLAFEAPLKELKERLARGERYFEDLIKRYLLENTHHTTILLKPQQGYSQRMDEEERQRLDAIRQKMTQEELRAVLDQTRELKRQQEAPDTPQALATIPVLRLEDLERKSRVIQLEVSELEGCQVLKHDLFTNGIVYLDVGFNLRLLPQELLPYVPLFGRALVELGTDKEDFVRLSQRIGRSTGGIRPSALVSAARNSDEGVSWLFLRGKSTILQTDELLAILRDILLNIKLDNRERFRQMVLEEKAENEARLVPMGHMLVNTRLRARFDQAGWVAEQMGGVEYLFFLRQLAEAVETDWPSVLKRLESLHRLLINRRAMLCNVTLAGEDGLVFMSALKKLLSEIPATTPGLMEWMPEKLAVNEGFTIPAQVNYVGKGANLFNLGYDYHASLLVILKYLRTTWLWEKVRVQGGAYGGYCLFDYRSGVLTYLSYRDPNLLQTISNYDGTSQYLRELEINPSELTKAIIGTIGDLDTYLLPDAKGYTSMTRFLTGETDADRQMWREQVLATDAKDFYAFSDVLREVSETGSVVVLGSPVAIEGANSQKTGWLEVRKVL